MLRGQASLARPEYTGRSRTRVAYPPLGSGDDRHLSGHLIESHCVEPLDSRDPSLYRCL